MKCIQCHQCHNDTNEKDGLCVICRNPHKFGQGEMKPLPNIPASRSKRPPNNIQGTEGGTLALSPSYTNKKLKLFARAQISYLLSLAYSGNMPNLISRLHLLQRSLRSGDFLNAR